MELDNNIIGATPLEDEDLKGLLPKTVFDRETLNLVEAENIMMAKTKFMTYKKYSNIEYLLSDLGVKSVHKLMFDNVWAWAGKYRTHDTNIGVPYFQIQTSVHNLLENYKFQFENVLNSDDKTKDEFCIRFHYDLVSIHPFANGNGRHSRQMADLLLQVLGRPIFPWNESEIIRDTDARKEYIEAIQYAQNYKTKGDVSKLLFVARKV